MDKELLKKKIVEVKIPEERINLGLRPFAANFPPMVINHEVVMASRGMPPEIPPAVSTDMVTVTEKYVPCPQGAPMFM